MGILQKTIYLYDEYTKHYCYKSKDEAEEGEETISGVYVLRDAVGGSAPDEMEITLEWE